MKSLLSLLKVEDRPSVDDVLPVLEEFADNLLQIQVSGLVVDDCEVDDAEGGLKRRVLVELV